METDWIKCDICQQNSLESLQCPADSKRSDISTGLGYSTFAANVIRFHALQQLPTHIDLNRLDDGNGIAATLLQHTAKWHISCHMKFNSTKLQRAEKRQASLDDNEPGPSTSKKFTRRSGKFEERGPETWFLCDDESSLSDPLREASTFHLDNRVRKCAIDLQDGRLLAKLSGGDLVAQEAKYHPRCLVSLYNRAEALQERSKQPDDDKKSHGIALAELLTYIDEARMDDDVAPVFNWADLVKLYSTRLEQLGVQQKTRPRSTELKHRILNQFPDLKAYKEGRDVSFSI